jgi:hypothetical protein
MNKVKLLVGCVFCIMLASGNVDAAAQDSFHDARPKMESDRAKEDAAKKDEQASAMKSAEKKANADFYAEPKTPPLSAGELKKAADAGKQAGGRDLRNVDNRDSGQLSSPTTPSTAKPAPTGGPAKGKAPGQ